MKATVTHVHICTMEPELGVQFQADAEDGSESTKQRGFLAGPPAELTAQLVAWAQKELDAKLSTLPLDLPPGAVTTALMKLRDARREEEVARARKVEFEAAASAAAHAATEAAAVRAAHQVEIERLAKDAERRSGALAEIAGQHATAVESMRATRAARDAAESERARLSAEAFAAEQARVSAEEARAKAAKEVAEMHAQIEAKRAELAAIEAKRAELATAAEVATKEQP